jgi:DNA-binding LytR/AlgR family response regulator
MTGIRIMLVEDDWIIAKEIAYTLQDLGFEVVGTFDTGEEAIQHVARLHPDLVLLDIDLAGELSGIEAGRKLKEAKVPFIFLTALADSHTIKQAKLVEPYAYLVKPVAPETLYSTIEITLYNASVGRQPETVATPLNERLSVEGSLFVKVKGRLEKLQLKDIRWIEASDIYALACTEKDKHLLSSSLKAVEEKFPERSFLRVHRSYVVNLEKIEAIEEDNLIIGTERIPIGKTYRDKLMSRLSFL